MHALEFRPYSAYNNYCTGTFIIPTEYRVPTRLQCCIFQCRFRLVVVVAMVTGGGAGGSDNGGGKVRNPMPRRSFILGGTCLE